MREDMYTRREPMNFELCEAVAGDAVVVVIALTYALCLYNFFG
jgi:hypothetical protein